MSNFENAKKFDEHLLFFGTVGTIACNVVKNRVDLFWTVGTIVCNVVSNRVDLFWPQNVCRRYAENSLDLSLDPN